jgi:hypothetical protein
MPLVIQEQISTHRNDPQYYPTDDQILLPSTLRGPQEGKLAEVESKTSTQELQRQMRSIRIALDRRGAM